MNVTCCGSTCRFMTAASMRSEFRQSTCVRECACLYVCVYVCVCVFVYVYVCVYPQGGGEVQRLFTM
jgi:hypothetical protein